MRLEPLGSPISPRIADVPAAAGLVPGSGTGELLEALTSGILADAQSQGGRLRGRAMELAFTDPNALRAILRQAYPDADRFDLQRLEHAAARGELPLPERVRFVDRDALAGASAAYDHRDGGTVRLARDLASDPALLQRAYAEEVGHHLDRWLGGRDAPGDEGAIFARGLLGGAALDDATLAAERWDRDHGTVAIDGRTVAVEFYGTASRLTLTCRAGAMWTKPALAKVPTSRGQGRSAPPSRRRRTASVRGCSRWRSSSRSLRT